MPEQSVIMSQLSDAQMQMRRTGIGASEIAAVCGISPWSTPTQVWLKKAPLDAAEPYDTTPLDNMAIKVGNILEEPLRQLYMNETGLFVVKYDETYRHPNVPFLLATPDGLCYGTERSTDVAHGLEIKNVGKRMAGAWDEGVPDYVAMQCYQNMMVTGYGQWDVAALLGGSDFQIFHLYRNEAIEESIIEAATTFWIDHVVADVPPPASDPEEKRAQLKHLFPSSVGKECKAPVEIDTFSETCLQLSRLSKVEKDIATEKQEAQNRLIEMVGNDYGVEFNGYKFTYGTQAGSTSYKDIALELAGGKIDPAMIEKYRGEPKRVARFTPPKD